MEESDYLFQEIENLNQLDSVQETKMKDEIKGIYHMLIRGEKLMKNDKERALSELKQNTLRIERVLKYIYQNWEKNEYFKIENELMKILRKSYFLLSEINMDFQNFEESIKYDQWVIISDLKAYSNWQSQS